MTRSDTFGKLQSIGSPSVNGYQTKRADHDLWSALGLLRHGRGGVTLLRNLYERRLSLSRPSASVPQTNIAWQNRTDRLYSASPILGNVEGRYEGVPDKILRLSIFKSPNPRPRE